MPSTAPPTTTAPPTGRQELLNIKHKLVDALADNAPQYWDALREFVTGKLNRQEFDFYANLFLNRQNAPLHNAFILATIHNAQKDFPSPANQHGANSQRRKRPIKDEDDDVAGVGGVRQEAKKKKRDNMSLDKTERERIKELAKIRNTETSAPINKPMSPPIRNVPMMPILKDERTPPTVNLGFSHGHFTPLCCGTKDLPNFEALRYRMATIAHENGLMGGVADESVEAMKYALESHVISIISSTIYKIRANRSMGITVSSKQPDTTATTNFHTGAFALPITSSPDLVRNIPIPLGMSSLSGARAATPAPSLLTTPSSISRQQDGKSSITLRDLSFSFAYNPHMLAESPINVEKLTNLMDEAGEGR